MYILAPYRAGYTRVAVIAEVYAARSASLPTACWRFDDFIDVDDHTIQRHDALVVLIFEVLDVGYVVLVHGNSVLRECRVPTAVAFPASE